MQAKKRRIANAAILTLVGSKVGSLNSYLGPWWGKESQNEYMYPKLILH